MKRTKHKRKIETGDEVFSWAVERQILTGDEDNIFTWEVERAWDVDVNAIGWAD